MPAVSFTNNWKNIADKLESKFREEFGGTLSVYVGEGDYTGTQFIKILPTSNSISERYTKGELREYQFQFIYYFMDANIRQGALTQILRIASRIESLMANNRSLVLADSTTIVNGRLLNYEIVEGDGGFEYLIEMDYVCQHLGNIG